MILFENVCLKYSKEFFTLFNVNFKIDNGEFVCVYGSKDSGKMCVLQLICGLIKPTSGSVKINGVEATKVDFKNSESLGYVPYKCNFFENKTVKKNLEYVLKLRKFNRYQISETVNDVSKRFEIENILNKKIKDLTLFEKYVVSLSRIALRQINFLVVDNIFEELSLLQSQQFLNLIKQHFMKNNATIIVATSSKTLLEQFSTHTICLDFGVITSDV